MLTVDRIPTHYINSWTLARELTFHLPTGQYQV